MQIKIVNIVNTYKVTKPYEVEPMNEQAKYPIAYSRERRKICQ